MNISIESNAARTASDRFIDTQEPVDGEYDSNTNNKNLTLNQGDGDNKIHFGQKSSESGFNEEISKMADAILDFMVEQDADITQENRDQYEDEIMTWLFYEQAKGDYKTIGDLWGAIAGPNKKLGVGELNSALGELFKDDNTQFLIALGNAKDQDQFNDLVDIHTRIANAEKTSFFNPTDFIFLSINILPPSDARQNLIDDMKDKITDVLDPENDISSYPTIYTAMLIYSYEGSTDKTNQVIDIAQGLGWKGTDLKEAMDAVEEYEGKITIDDLLHYVQEQEALTKNNTADENSWSVITAMNEWGFPEEHVDAVFIEEGKKPDNNLDYLVTASSLDDDTDATLVQEFISEYATALDINSSDDIEASTPPEKLEAKLAYIIAESLNARNNPVDGENAIEIAKSLIAQENTSLEDIIWALHYGDYSDLTNGNAKRKVKDAVEIMNADNQEQEQRDINASIQDSPQDVLKLRSALLNFASQADINQGEVMQMVDDLLATDSFTTIGELWQFLTGSSKQNGALKETRLNELLDLDFSNESFQNVLEKADTHKERANILHIYQTAQDREMDIKGNYGLNYLLGDISNNYDAKFIAALADVDDTDPAKKIKAVLEHKAFPDASVKPYSEKGLTSQINRFNDEFYVYMLLAAFPEKNSDWAENIVSLAEERGLTSQDFLDAIEKKGDLEEAIKHTANDKAVTDAQREQSGKRNKQEQVDTVMTNAGFATSTINDIKKNSDYHRLANIHELTDLSGPTDKKFETALSSIASVFNGDTDNDTSALSYLIFTVANARTGAESGDGNFIDADEALEIAEQLVDKNYNLRDVARVLTHKPSLAGDNFNDIKENIQIEIASLDSIKSYDGVDTLVKESLERGMTYNNIFNALAFGIDHNIRNKDPEKYQIHEDISDKKEIRKEIFDKINEIRINRGQAPLSEDINVRREAAYNALNGDVKNIAELLDHDDLQEIFEKPVEKDNQALYRSLIARALGVNLTDGNTTLINNILSFAIGDTDNKEFGISGRNLLAILHMAQAEAKAGTSSTDILERAQELTSYASQIMDIAQDKGMSSERAQDVLHEILYHNPGGKTGELRDPDDSIQMLEWLSGNDQREGNKAAITIDNVPDWLKNTKIGYNDDPDTNYTMGKTKGGNFIAETNLEQVDSLTALISLMADDVSKPEDSDEAIENVWEARNEEDNTVGKYLDSRIFL